MSSKSHQRSIQSTSRVLLVGGPRPPGNIEAYKRRFGPDVRHVCTHVQHPSADHVIREIERFRPTLVVCARGLTRTNHGKTLHAYCRRHGISYRADRGFPNPERLCVELSRRRR